MQLKSELYKEVEMFAQEKSAGEVGRSRLTSLPKRVVSWNFYSLPQILLSSLHSQDLIYSCILWQIIQVFAEVMDRSWVILFSQSLCPALKPRIAELPQRCPCVAELCSVFLGQGIFGEGAVGVHCSVVNRRLMQGLLSFPQWLLGWGHTGRAGLQLRHIPPAHVWPPAFVPSTYSLVLVCFGRKTDCFAWLQKQQPVVLLF